MACADHGNEKCPMCTERAKAAALKIKPHKVTPGLTLSQIVRIVESVSRCYDADEVVQIERDWIIARYGELRIRLSFDIASERAREEWLSHALAARARETID